ncbi:phosphoenolpyruvate carboxykinase (ATP) [Fervidibacillus albus]|uniref:Phosphoenolpyruvate carboxykinase (ATP) n=1 Tax=Fervidibacillus albus TaxID=2980026 RepID=A0A9E8LUR8_9BACI|nr:phosphoenolpyruvate carboxykinase (ATP) [Fervidibacillus albus]WAA10060.1 phosphoenolpyruvate carboxykinase (ATP) [Fervidibacillus albus]
METLATLNTLNDLLIGDNILEQMSVSKLVEKIIEKKEGILTDSGAISVKTGKYTGRSPKDKYIVKDEMTEHKVDWGNVNQPISSKAFLQLYGKVINYLKKKNELFVFKGYAGADPEYRLPIQVITEFAWHNLFAQQLFIRPTEGELSNHTAEFTVLFAPKFKADPDIDGVRSETFIIISFEHRIVLIGGTEYAGEVKKSIFSVMNFLLPEKEIFPMHCSANVGNDDDVTLFFGLSGTGKTTLSNDPNRRLIGDDEHAWSQKGVFNIEGGCYAKCIHLSKEKEPQIYNAISYGSVLENVVIDEHTRIPDFDDGRLTENTRAAYPLHHISNIVQPSLAGHPKTIIFLTADAFGVLPPIAKLTKEQAMYHFLSGYTSKMAGTERGVTKPEATFSACYGAPFLPLPPTKYAEMLGERIDRYDVDVYLVNTGWTGGPYGVGKRIELMFTRAMIQAAIHGDLKDIPTFKENIFGFHIPISVPNVPSKLLKPENTWNDQQLYKESAKQLAQKFRLNFEKFGGVHLHIKELGGPIE